MTSNGVAVKRNDIQWLRAIAAAEVVLWHSDLATKSFSDAHIQNTAYGPFGGIGVEIFFVLSGFVICMQAPTYLTGTAFMKARLYRLTPMYWFFTSLVVMAYLANPAWKLHGFDFNPVHIVKSYLYLPQQRQPVLGVGWTLEYEIIFYAVVAVAMLLWQGMRHREQLVVGVILAGLGTVGSSLGIESISNILDFRLVSPYMLAF